MGDRTHSARSSATWRLVRAQHGVLTHDDLLRLGFSAKGIKHRVANGRLHTIARGIYAVGRPELTPNGRWMAAVLVCGEDAALSHRSAAALWGIGYEEGKRIDVSIRRRSRLERPGIVVHQRPTLPDLSRVTLPALSATP